jgi:hypothetical protein
MKQLLYTLLLLSSFSCDKQETKKPVTADYYDLDTIQTDYLLSYSDDSLGNDLGYKNLKGDVIIPEGKYSHCWTDTFRNFAFVYDSLRTNSKIVAIDRKERILFDAFLFDNYPDEPSEGLFRVRRNGKTGFANEQGQIIIPCQFQCAWPFENGLAKVAFKCKEAKEDEHITSISDEWIHIDKKGNKVENAR